MINIIRDELRNFMFGKKIIIVLFAFVFLAEDIVTRMIHLSKLTGMEFSKYEPYILILSYVIHAAFIPLILLVVMSDFPRKENQCIYAVTRVGRKKWLIAELIYVGIADFLILFLFFLFIILWLGKSGVWIGSWSEYMTVFHKYYPAEYLSNTHLFIEAETVTQGALTEVLLHASLLMWLYLFYLSQLICFFRLRENKKIGFLIAVLILAVGVISTFFDGGVKWIFPMAHAVYGQHFQELLVKPICDLRLSYIYFFTMNIILIVANQKQIKSCMIGDEK